MTWYWISTKLLTAGYAVDSQGIVRVSAPILKRWVGKPMSELQAAYSRYGATIVRLGE